MWKIVDHLNQSNPYESQVCDGVRKIIWPMNPHMLGASSSMNHLKLLGVCVAPSPITKEVTIQVTSCREVRSFLSHHRLPPLL